MQSARALHAAFPAAQSSDLYSLVATNKGGHDADPDGVVLDVLDTLAEELMRYCRSVHATTPRLKVGLFVTTTPECIDKHVPDNSHVGVRWVPSKPVFGPPSDPDDPDDARVTPNTTDPYPRKVYRVANSDGEGMVAGSVNHTV